MSRDIEEKLIDAALRLDTSEKFRAVFDAVAVIAPTLDAATLETLAEEFGRFPDVPPAFRPEQEDHPPRRFAWWLLWEETVGEALLQGGERSLPALRPAAFGAGRNQGWAFHLLCRLAAMGVGREEFFEDVRREFPRLNLDARMLVVDELKGQGNSTVDYYWRLKISDPSFAAVVEGLKDLPGYREAQKALSALDTTEDGGD